MLNLRNVPSTDWLRRKSEFGDHLDLWVSSGWCADPRRSSVPGEERGSVELGTVQRQELLQHQQCVVSYACQRRLKKHS